MLPKNVDFSIWVGFPTRVDAQIGHSYPLPRLRVCQKQAQIRHLGASGTGNAVEIGSGPATVRDQAKSRSVPRATGAQPGRRNGRSRARRPARSAVTTVAAVFLCLWRRAGMVRTLLHMAVCVPALALCQTDSVQIGLEASAGGDTTGIVAPLAAESTHPALDFGHDAVIEGREVVARASWKSDGVRRIGREELQRSGTLGQALSREPGIVVRHAGGLGAWTQMQVRGAPAQQTRVFLDGVPVGGSNGSIVDLGPIPVDGLELVELRQAGDPGSGGAPRLDLRSRSGWARLGASVRQGSYGEQGLSVWGGDPSGKATASVWWERSDNDYPFFWDNGTTYNTKDDRTVRLGNNGYGAVGVAVGFRPTSDLQFLGRWESTEKGVTSASNPDPDAEFRAGSFQGSIDWQREGGVHPRASASLRRYSTRWRDPSRSADYSVARGADDVGWDGRAGVGAGGGIASWLRADVDLEIRRESSERDSRGGVSSTPDGDRLAMGSDLRVRMGPDGGFWGLDLSGTAGWKRDRRDFVDEMSVARDTGLIELDWLPVGGSAKLWWNSIRNLSIWVSGQASRRVPDFGEWMGDGGFILANPDLVPERSLGVELAARFVKGPWLVAPTLWARRYERPISRVSRGGGPLGIHENGPDSRFLGLDADVSYCVPVGWIRLTGTVQDAIQTDPNPALDGNRPRWTPSAKGALELGANLRSWLRAGYTLDARGEVYANEFNDPDSRRAASLVQGAWLSGSWHSLRLTGSVANIADKPTRDWEHLPLAGRRFLARLDWNTDFTNLGGEQK